MLADDRRRSEETQPEVTTLDARTEDAAEMSHVWFATIGIALQPISTASGNIGLGVATLGLALRMAGVALHTAKGPQGEMTIALRYVPRLRRSRRLLHGWSELLMQGWMWCLLAWLAWSWLSLAWSPDRRFGIEQFRATRVLLWIPLLWPIRHRWKTLVGGMLTGTTVMALLQASQMRFGWPESHFGVGAGLTTPTQTGLWAAVALSYWLIIAVGSTLSVALGSLPFAALTGVGLVWAATRASAIGLMVELIVANIVLALTSPGWLARAIMRCLVGLVILGAAFVFAGQALKAKIDQAITETSESLRGAVEVTGAQTVAEGMTAELRLAMWKAALAGWKSSPVAGVGIGGIPSVMQQTTTRSPTLDLKAVRMIHGTYVQTLVETGVVGLGLLMGFAILLFRDALRGLRGQPLLVASFGALVVWFVAAAFDGYQQSGGFLSVGAILIPLALADLRAGTGIQTTAKDSRTP